MRLGDADAIVNIWHREGNFLHLKRCDLETASIDSIIITTENVKTAFLVNISIIGCEKRIIVKDSQSKFRFILITSHQGIALTSYTTFGSNKELGMRKRMTKTSCYAFSIVIVIRWDYTSLRWCVCVIESGIWQYLTKSKHIRMRHWSCSCLKEIHTVGKSL